MPELNTKNVLIVAIAVTISLVAIVAGIAFGVTRGMQINEDARTKQVTACLESGATAAECTVLSVRGGR